MIYKLAVGQIVEFPVTLVINDAGRNKEFKFTLQGNRLGSDEIAAMFQEDGGMLLAEFKAKAVRANITGWSGQKLVLGDDNEPAPFSAEAFDCMLVVPNASELIYDGWIQAIQASETAVGRAKK